MKLTSLADVARYVVDRQSTDSLFDAEPAASRQVIMKLGREVDTLTSLATVPSETFTPDERQSIVKSSRKWHGTSSYDAAADLLVYGWPDGVKQATAILKTLETALPASLARRKQFQTGPVPRGGMLINMPAVIGGMPNQFVQRVPSHKLTTGNRLYRVGVNTAVSAGVSPEVLLARSTTIAALVRLLAIRGQQATVDVFMATKHQDCRSLVIWSPCSAGASVDLSKIVFACGHTAMIRRIMFAAMELLPAGATSPYTYGSPVPVARASKAIASQYDLIVDSSAASEDGLPMDIQWTRPEHQVRWIKAALRKMGVTAR